MPTHKSNGNSNLNPPANNKRGDVFHKNSCNEQDKKQLTQKELLTVDEAALYIGLSVKGVYDLIRRDSGFAAKIKMYGRTYFRRSLIDQWLAERDKKDRQYKYVVTKLSTGENFTIEAKSHTHARRKVCKADGVGEAGIFDYGAKKIKSTKGECDTNA